MPCHLVLLWLSKLAPKPRLFSNIELYRNRGFGLSIDGFGFSISKWHSSSVMTVPQMLKQHAAATRPWCSDLSCLLLCLRALSPRSNWDRLRHCIYCMRGRLRTNEWKSVGKQSSVLKLLTSDSEAAFTLQRCWWCGVRRYNRLR